MKPFSAILFFSVCAFGATQSSTTDTVGGLFERQSAAQTRKDDSASARHHASTAVSSGRSIGGMKSITDVAVSAGKYLVVGKPVTVAAGDTLLVPEGREVLFTNFAGITVSAGGTLIATGTKERPIYFTSLQDTAGAASAFDWNGIDVKKGAFARFTYCFIAFSSSGITAEDSTGVLLENCIFSVNGQWNFSVSGVITQVPDLKPFTYMPKRVTVVLAPVTRSDTVVSTQPALQMSKHHKLRPRDLILSGVGVALAAAGSIVLYQANRYQSDYNSYVPGNAAFDEATPAMRQNRFDDLRQSYTTATGVGWSLVGLAVVDILCVAITIRF